MTIPGTADPSKQPGHGEEIEQGKSDEKHCVEGGFGPHFSLQNVLSRLSHDWILLGCILLTGSLCFGLGLLLAREKGTAKDSLWIEQLPASVLPGSVGTSTNNPTTTIQAPSTVPAAVPNTVSQPAAAAATLPLRSGTYMASKTGSKYYLPTCGSAKRIKEENRVWFATKQQAEAAGYEPAANCKGL